MLTLTNTITTWILDRASWILATLTIVSELISVLRFAFPQYYTMLTVIKATAIDAPKETLRQMAMNGLLN